MRVRAGLICSLAGVLAGCGGGTAGHGTGGSAGGGSGGGAAGASGGTGGDAAGGSSGSAGGNGGGAAGTSGGAGTGGNAGTGGGAGTSASVDAAVDQPIGDDAADSDGDGAIACTPTERPALRGAPDILILLDASGSMNNDSNDMTCLPSGCGAISKWAQVVPAINQIVAATESSVNWGLKFFADVDNRCGVGPNPAVPVGPSNAAAIAAAIASRTSANGGVANGSQTPTRVAETVAADILSALPDSNPKFILLATDGLPNCMTVAQFQNDDSVAAINAVSATAARGFPTFVVGIATSGLISDYTLSAMATAGGRPRAGDPAYYPVTTTDELRGVLDGIVAQAGTCALGIGTPPPGGSLDAIEVRGDHTLIARDTTHASGWDYADVAHTSISLFGPTCAAVRNGTVQQITIGFLCPPAG